MNVDRAGSPPVRAERATPGGEGVAVGVARCAPSERQVRSVGTSLSGVYGLREIQVRGEKKKLGRCAIWVNCKARVMRCRRRQILSFFCESFNWGGWKMWRYGKKSFVKRATYFVVNKWTYECDLWRCWVLMSLCECMQFDRIYVFQRISGIRKQAAGHIRGTGLRSNEGWGLSKPCTHSSDFRCTWQVATNLLKKPYEQSYERMILY